MTDVMLSSRPMLFVAYPCRQILTIRTKSSLMRSNNTILAASVHCIYLLNWSLQPFSQYYNLDSYPTYVLCVNFILEWRDQLFNIDFERQIDKLLMTILF